MKYRTSPAGPVAFYFFPSQGKVKKQKTLCALCDFAVNKSVPIWVKQTNQAGKDS